MGKFPDRLGDCEMMWKDCPQMVSKVLPHFSLDNALLENKQLTLLTAAIFEAK